MVDSRRHGNLKVGGGRVPLDENVIPLVVSVSSPNRPCSFGSLRCRLALLVCSVILGGVTSRRCILVAVV
jgi:hypothetical protein